MKIRWTRKGYRKGLEEKEDKKMARIERKTEGERERLRS